MNSEQHLETFKEFLRFESVSTDSAYSKHLRECAQWLKNRFDKMGLDCKIHDTPRHPIVVAQSKKDPNKKSLLICFHFTKQSEIR
jgi:acetylornithine deacetylase/succinyl-diaminopimelate desuccinylase-like protein